MIRWLRRPIVWVPISVALLALVAWRSRAWEAGSILGAPDPVPLVIAVALNGPVAVLWAIRSHDLLGGAGRAVGVGALVPMTVFANTINNLTPGSAGELVRMWLLRASHDVPYVTGGAVILIERVVAIAYLGSSAAIIWVGYQAGLPGWLVGAGLLVVAAAPSVVYRLGLRPAELVAGLPLGRAIGARRGERVTATLRRIDTTVASLLTNPRRAVVFAVTSGAVFACYALQLSLVARSLGVSLDPILAWGALGLAITFGVLSLLPFGLGAADVALVALLGGLGVPAPAATAIAFGYRLVATLPLGLAGIAAYAHLSSRLPERGAAGAMDAARRALETDGMSE